MTPRQPDLPWLRAQLSRSVDVAASYVIFPGRSFTYHGDVAPGFGPFVVPFFGPSCGSFVVPYLGLV